MPLNEDLKRIVELAGTDPRYASLVEALTEECPACKGTNRISTSDGEREERCIFCDTGHVLRLKWQQGELAGVLLWDHRRITERTVHTGDKEWLRSYKLQGVIENCFGFSDCNERAAQLVLRFLEATHV